MKKQGANPRRTSTLLLFVLLQLKRPGVQPVISALLGDQILMAAALDDAAVVQHHDGIGVAHG